MNGILSSYWRRTVIVVALLLPLAVVVAVLPASAQEAGGYVAGTVQTSDGEPSVGAQVFVVGTQRGGVTDGEGNFRIGPLTAGAYRVQVTYIGYMDVSEAVEVTPGTTLEIGFTLDPMPIHAPGITVTAVTPGLQRQVEMQAQALSEASVDDTGKLLRLLPGTDAIRRGPINLDPVVRGLKENQVGQYVDGTRMFPAGPARMDSSLSHVDPTSLTSIEVAQGPYALTWGAGNLTAIRAETHPLPAPGAAPLGFSLVTGFEGNTNAANVGGRLSGRNGMTGYEVSGVYREGSDYESGDGSTVPGNYSAAEVRGKVGFNLDDRSLLSFAGNYHDQGRTDYPGRLLSAKFFHAFNINGRYLYAKSEGTLRSFDGSLYYSNVEHDMDNEGKPTAEPNPGRMPPFALQIDVETESKTTGGRGAFELALSGDAVAEVGGDFYNLKRDAIRTVARKENGMTLFEDLIWPGATVTDGGLFARVSNPWSETVGFTATIRTDFVSADADTASQFFLENVSDELSSSETNWSGAVTTDLTMDEHWSLSLGLGSAVRTADALERYSDRFPSTKFQTSAEFVGNPALDPERSTQFDAWLNGNYDVFALQFNIFNRWLDDFITLEATDLPKRLPLSPDTVYQYINGEGRYWGYEMSLGVRMSDRWTFTGSTDYLWGQDDTLDEPALGVSPARLKASFRYDAVRNVYWAQAGVLAANRQDRVAVKRGETPTAGWATVDLRGGVRLAPGLDLRLGIVNLLNKQYTNHLNAKNPFNGQQIPEPGRLFFIDLTFTR